MNIRLTPYQYEKSKNLQYSIAIIKLVKNIKKLFDITPKYQKYTVLSLLTGIVDKKSLKSEGFNFSETMYRTAKRKINDDKIEKRNINIPESKKPKTELVKNMVINELKNHSEITSSFYYKQPVYNLQETKHQIFLKIKRENPVLKLSRTKFYELCPKNFQYRKKKTDMCDICVNGKKLIKKFGKNSKNEDICFYKNHLKLNKIQKENLQNKINKLEENECIVITDFKENFKIGGGPVELAQTFYNKSQITNLGFCVIYRKNDLVIKKYINYLSNVISHNSNFVKIAIGKLINKYLPMYKKIHFWSDNAGHFRSSELLKYILVDLCNNGIETSMNYFVEYHGKTILDGHFGLLQKVFNFNEKKEEITTIDQVIRIFKNEFFKYETEAYFESIDDIETQEYIEKIKINQPKSYLSFIQEKGAIFGNSVSNFIKEKYNKIKLKFIKIKEKRCVKYAPKLKNNNDWKISSLKRQIMDKRVEFW